MTRTSPIAHFFGLFLHISHARLTPTAVAVREFVTMIDDNDESVSQWFVFV